MINKKISNKDFLVRDPVCGMRIEPEYSFDVDFYKGRILYFCSYPCKKEFEADPEKYFTELSLKVNENEQSGKYY